MTSVGVKIRVNGLWRLRWNDVTVAGTAATIFPSEVNHFPPNICSLASVFSSPEGSARGVETVISGGGGGISVRVMMSLTGNDSPID